MAFVLAGLMLLLFTVLMSGEAGYGQYLAITVHAFLILAFGALLTFPLQLVQGDLQLQLSLALLTPFLDATSVLYRMLHGITIFSLWAVVVTGLGVSKINPRVSWAVASAVLMGLYVVVLAGAAALRP